MHAQVPDRDTEARDQRQFDEAVNRKGKAVLEVIAGVGILAAVLMSMVALIQSGQRSELSASVRPMVKQVAAAATASTAAPTPVDLKIIGSYKVGPDCKKHDAFSKT
ncbi:MAG TPA: hypothetical protein VES97_12520, partial [Solirubrobacteraceae bacterium]|nr:hypothetical protein [Solirubrobacteraceae bacterium]